MTIPVSQTATKVHPRQSQRTFWLEVLLVVAITAIAIFLRYYKIGQVPPGLNSDEAVGAMGALETLRHGPQLYYAGQGGGGSLGFYIAAIGFAIFGPSAATIRGTAAFAGLVGVVAAYFATREMFREYIGLNRARTLASLAALGLATSLWHTQSSRVAFAAIGVPFLQLPANYFLWRGLNTGRRIHFVISGVFLASLMYRTSLPSNISSTAWKAKPSLRPAAPKHSRRWRWSMQPIFQRKRAGWSIPGNC